MNNKKEFFASQRPHVLMITNHGIHHWDIIPGLPDTGGQNVFVNQFTATLAKSGFKITVVNRGGYPHPTTGEMRTGVHYKDENQRILFLEDGFGEFVRKEDMDARMPYLARALQDHIATEKINVDLIISHYWDGAKVGVLYNQTLADPIKHIWVPHSLGAVKKRNIDPSQWEKLRIDTRIYIEKEVIRSIDGIAATSAIIRHSLKEDYSYEDTAFFLPPCVDTERYHPRVIGEKHPIWAFLSEHAGITSSKIRESKIITEISRTDSTKRKDVLIKAFAEVNKRYPDTFLVISIDQTNQTLAQELCDLIELLNIRERTAVLGSVWEELPDIYAVTDIYCTPSVMEGFGMTPQEAAATKVPVVSSQLVPFVMEYLLGDNVIEKSYGEENQKVRMGAGAIVVSADDVSGFAYALEMMLADEPLRRKLGEDAYRITIPYFTWDNSVNLFLEESSINKTFKERLR